MHRNIAFPPLVDDIPDETNIFLYQMNDKENLNTKFMTIPNKIRNIPNEFNFLSLTIFKIKTQFLQIKFTRSNNFII